MVRSNIVLRLATLGIAGMFVIGGSASAQIPIQPAEGQVPPAPSWAITPAPGSVPASGKSDDRIMLGSSAPTELYDHGDPTNQEQYMLELVNRARANPAAEGEMLASVNDPQINSSYQYFNISRDKLRNDFATYPARPPLAFNKSLIIAARNHGHDMDQNNFQGHVGSDGSSPGDRMVAAGYGDGNYYGENVAAYSYSTFFGHVGLNVDWGEQNQIELGHRSNIMNFKDFQYTEIGIGIIENGQQPPHVGPFVITQDFGRHSYPFIVGVVYRDLNSNNFYDPGEGMPGVTIMPSSGQYYAITSGSGGYAIPCPKSGSMSVTASGGGLSAPITSSVTFNGDNIKLDFIPGMESVPAQVELNLPENGVVLATDNVDLSWKAIPGATAYHVQVSTDPNFGSDLILDDETLTGTTTKLSGLLTQNYYYWRVRAKNSNGWGVFSQKRIIEVAMPPAALVPTAPANGSSVAPGTIEFRWDPAPAEVEFYWFEMGTDPTMATVDMIDSSLLDPWKFAYNLPAGKTYYWRAKARNVNGWGVYSPIWSVSTSTSGVERGANAAARLAANTPNPFTGSTTISYTLARAGNVKLTVVNAMGQEVAMLASGPQTAGTHNVTWEAGGLADGVYYCRLSAGTFTQTRAMILTR